MINKSFKTQLNPTPKQKQLFHEYAGLSRFAYNWGLSKQIENYENGGKFLSAITLNKILVEEKRNGNFAWMYSYSKSTPQEALRNLEQAFKTFFQNVKKNKKGKKGYPRFKSKHKSPPKFCVSGKNEIHVEQGKIRLPRIGWVKLFEKDYIPEGRYYTARISYKAGKWFVSVQKEIEVEDTPTNDNIVGIDLGIKSIAVTSDGEELPNPKFYDRYQDKIKREQRKLQRKEKGSRRYGKQKIRLQKAHYKKSCYRNNFLHEFTTSVVKAKPSMVVMEDLNISGMLKNRKLSRSISDLGLYELQRQLEYKCSWNGIDFVLADRFFPSSKTCSQCGKVKDELSLSERTYTCECGLEIDRDLNAAINLRKYGELSRNRQKTFVELGDLSKSYSKTSVEAKSTMGVY